MVSRTVAALTPDDQDQDQDPTTPSTTQAPPATDKAADGDGNESSPRYSTPLKDRAKLSVEECLYLATRGGAACLNLSHKIGAFEVGMEWDAQLIQLATIPPPPPEPLTPSYSHPTTRGQGDGEGEGVVGEGEGDEMGMGNGDEGLVELWGKETWGEKVAKWLFCGDDRNTRKVYVRGRLVWERG